MPSLAHVPDSTGLAHRPNPADPAVLEDRVQPGGAGPRVSGVLKPREPALQDFAEFYRGTHPGLVAELYAYTGDLAEAQEIVQEAFIRAWQHWRRIQHTTSRGHGWRGSPTGW